MANYFPGYGPVPPSSTNTSYIAAPPVPQSAIQIGNPDPVVTFHMDGNITTRAGNISAEEWITVIKIMKQLIIDMSKDTELASKYPYIQDAAHTWLLEELKK
jgi:hypothetical protein